MPDSRIALIFKILLEGVDAVKGAQKANQDLAKSTREAAKAAKETKSEFSELGNKLVEFVGAAELFHFAKESVEEFAKLNRSFNALGITMANMGVSGDRDLGKIKDELEAVAAGGGPLVSDLVPAFQKFTGVTKDTGAAMTAVKLAVNVAESGITDMDGAVSGVTALLQGKGKAAAMAFGLELNHLNGTAKTNAELMRETWAAFDKVSTSIEDSENKLNRMSSTWDKFKREAGEGLSKTLDLIEPVFFHLIAGFKDVGAIAGFLFNEIISGAEDMLPVLKAAFDFKSLFKDPTNYGETLNQAAKKFYADAKGNAEAFAEQVADNHRRDAKETEATEADKQKLIDQANRVGLSKREKASQAERDKVLKAENKLAVEIAQAKVDHEKDGTAARYDAEKKLLDAQEKEAVDAARREGADVENVRAIFRQKRLNAEQAHEEQVKALHAQAQAEILAAELESAQAGSEAQWQIKLAQFDNERRATLDAFKGTAEDKKALEQAFAIWRAAFILGHEKEVNQSSLNAYNELLTQKMALDQEAAKLNLDAAILAHRDTYDAQLALINAQYAEQVTAEEQHYAEEQTRFLDNCEALEEAERQHLRKMALLKQGHEQGVQGLNEQTTQSEYSQMQAILGGTSRFLQANFKNKKAAAIAGVALDTASAIMGIWKEWSGTPYVAAILTALVVAQAAMQVSAINKQQPHTQGGFDDPAHDAMAEVGGRRWAKDLVTKVSAGFNQGLMDAAKSQDRGPTKAVQDQHVMAAAAAQSPAGVAGGDGGAGGTGGPGGRGSEAAAGPTFVFNAPIYGGDAGLRQLTRELTRAARLDSSRLVAGGS